MPADDFYGAVKGPYDDFRHESVTRSRSPEVSSTAFRTQPSDLQPVPLMDMGFAVSCPLARHRMPLIRFLYIGSYVCSTLPSDPASRRRPCASLSLHPHQVVKGTFTPKLSNMLGTQRERGTAYGSPSQVFVVIAAAAPMGRCKRCAPQERCGHSTVVCIPGGVSHASFPVSMPSFYSCECANASSFLIFLHQQCQCLRTFFSRLCPPKTPTASQAIGSE